VSILSSLKNFFVPSEEEGAKRRLAVFGTESKAVATAGVAVAAVAAIAAAPVAIGGAATTATRSAIRAVASTVATSYAGASLKTQIAVPAFALVGAGVLSQTKKPVETLLNTPSGLVNFGSNVGTLIENPSLENLTTIAKENPGISGLAVAGGLLAAGTAVRGVAGIAATALNTSAVKENTQASALMQEVTSNSDDLPSMGSPQALNASPLASSTLAAPPIVKESSRIAMKTPKKGAARKKKHPALTSINNSTRVYLDGRKQNIYNKVNQLS